MKQSIKLFLDYIRHKYKEQIENTLPDEREILINHKLHSEIEIFSKLSKKEQYEHFGFYISLEDLKEEFPIEFFIDNQKQINYELGMNLFKEKFDGEYHEKLNNSSISPSKKRNSDYDSISVGDVFEHKSDGSNWKVIDKLRNSDGEDSILFQPDWLETPTIMTYTLAEKSLNLNKERKSVPNSNKKRLKLPKFDKLKLGQRIYTENKYLGTIIKLYDLKYNGIEIDFGNKVEFLSYPQEIPNDWYFSNEYDEIENSIKEGDYSYEFFNDFLKNGTENSDLLDKNFYSEKIKKYLKSQRVLLSRKLINFTKNLKNEIKYRTLIFDNFYIDTTFRLRKDIWLRGLLVENLDENLRESILDFSFLENKLLSDELKNKNIRITALLYSEGKNREFLVEDLLSRFLNNSKNLSEIYNLDFKGESSIILSRYSKEIELIYLIIFNIMDLYNNKSKISKKIYVNNPKNNKKRTHNNKNLLPFKTIKLGPVEEFKIYLNKYEKDILELNHKFLVRPFWRHFNDKEIFKNLYKKYKEGTLDDKYQVDEDGVIKILIAEHIRGKGDFVEKDVKLIY